MRKWKTRAAPDDPNVWSDVSGMWPTRQGTYETADFLDSGSGLTATGEVAGAGKGLTAWAFQGLSATRSYIVGTKIWEYASSTLTDRTNSLTVTGATMMCQYGDITILALGTGTALAASPGSANFAAISGAPSAKYVVVQSNALVAFNTSTSADGWAASDVGDYTNWSTGEAASGRILESNGPITGAVAFGNDILVFKKNAIFRMTYVGGVVKWAIQKIWEGVGASNGTGAVNPIVSCGDRVFFLGSTSNTNLDAYYVFDGVSAPRLVSGDVALLGGVGNLVGGSPVYDPVERCVTVVGFDLTDTGASYFYNLESDAWGKTAVGPCVSSERPLQVRGDYYAVSSHYNAVCTLRPLWHVTATDTFTLHLPVTPGGSTTCTGYVQSPFMSKSGDPGRLTTFNRCTPILRRRTNNSGGSPSPLASLSFTLFTERSDTSAYATNAVTESTTRNRFDLLGAANTKTYGRFKVTYTDMDVEIDDLAVDMVDAGAN